MSLIYLIIFLMPAYSIRLDLAGFSFSLLELMIYILFVWWLCNKFSRGWDFSNLLIFKRVFYATFLIFVGLTAATLNAFDLESAVGIWKEWFLAPVLFFIVFLDIAKNNNQIKKSIISSVLSGSVVAIISLFYYLTDRLTYDGRLEAFYNSPNYLAMFLGPVLVMNFYLLIFLNFKPLVRILLALNSFLLVLVFFLTYSYGAWMGLFCGSLALMLSLKKFRAKKRQYLGLFLIFLALFFAVWLNLKTDKLNKLLSFSNSSLESRLMIWNSASEILKDQPLIGIGPGNFQKFYLEKQSKFKKPYLEWAVPHPHNLFLAFWLYGGAAALIGFLWLMLLLFYRILFKRKTILGFFVAAVLVYFLVHGLVDTTYWKNDLSILFWFFIALSCTSYRLSYQQRKGGSLSLIEKVD